MMGLFYIPCMSCKQTFAWQSSLPQLCSNCTSKTIQTGTQQFQIGVATPLKATGWECPKCTRVYGPSVTECGPCNSLLGGTVTITPFNPFSPSTAMPWVEPKGTLTVSK